MQIPRRWGFGRFYFAEQLVEHPDEVVVVRTSEDLCDERPAFDEELGSQFHTHEHQLRLAVGILHPGSTDVGGTIMQHDVGFPVLQLAADEVATLCGGDVGCEGDDARYWFNGYKINTWVSERKKSSVRSLLERVKYAPTMTLFTGIYLLATCSQPP